MKYPIQHLELDVLPLRQYWLFAINEDIGNLLLQPDKSRLHWLLFDWTVYQPSRREQMRQASEQSEAQMERREFHYKWRKALLLYILTFDDVYEEYQRQIWKALYKELQKLNIPVSIIPQLIEDLRDDERKFNQEKPSWMSQSEMKYDRTHKIRLSQQDIIVSYTPPEESTGEVIINASGVQRLTILR